MRVGVDGMTERQRSRESGAPSVGSEGRGSKCLLCSSPDDHFHRSPHQPLLSPPRCCTMSAPSAAGGSHQLDPNRLQAPSGGFVDKIDPFKKGSLKRKQKKSQGSSRYRLTSEVELQQLPQLKGNCPIPSAAAAVSLPTPSVDRCSSGRTGESVREEVAPVLHRLRLHGPGR